MHSIVETDNVVERLAALSPAKRELLLRRLQEAKRTPSSARPVKQRGLENAYTAPRTLIEEVLVELWASILGLARIGIEDDFFQAGGHSLLATQAVARMREIFDIELPLEALFARPTISAIAAQIEDGQYARQEAPPLTPVPRGGVLPLSYTQERIWFLIKLDPTNVAYNVPRVLRLLGDLNIAALERTFTEVIRRHEILRTSFPAVDGQPSQIIHPPEQFVIPVIDFSDVPEGEREQAAVRYWQAKGQAPFDLEHAPLLRVELLRFSASDHALLLTEHHLVHDGWTQGVLMRELITLYGAFSQGQTSPLPEPTIQFADFASWQRRWLEGGVMRRQLDYWRRQLAGAPSLLQLPTQRPRPRLLRSAGAQQVLWIPGALADSLRALARREGVTLFMVLVAALDVVLGRCADTEDVCVGSGIANRRNKDAESVLGMILNSVVLRTNLGGNPSFRELLTRVRQVCIGAYANQDVPFSKVVEELQPRRALDRAPLFQIMFSLHDSPAPQLRMPGVEVRPVGFHNRSAKFDLNIIAQASAEQRAGEEANDVRRSIWMGWEYNTDVYDKPTIERLTGYFRNVLKGIVSNPDSTISELPLLDAAERHRILENWSSPGADYLPNRCLHELFAAQAARTPDAVAAVYEDQHLTYAQLDRRSNQLAHHLCELGVGPEVVVGLCVERSLDMVVGLLGILKAGGAYLPLDPSYPPERLAYMMADAHVRVLVTQHTLLPELSGHAAHVVRLDADWPSISRHPENPPSSRALPENVAYAIYTSGSTGSPKGVMVTHACVSRLFDATKAWFDFGDRDVWTLFHSYAFDFSVWEIWGALLHGGRAVVVPHWVSRSPEAFHELLVRERVTILNQTPSAFAQLQRVAGRAGTALALRAVIFGGEALRPVDLRPWLSRHGETRPQLVNMYGITETTVHVSYRPLRLKDAEGPAASPIGRGIPDMKVYVLDRHLQPVPVAVCGELYVGGAGLARGYLGRPGLTAERFIPSRFGDGERLYRTGDLARWRFDGELEFIGRIDHQVKLRGYRIEPGEIEAGLRAHAGVKDAVVVAREDAANEKRLVGYVVGRDDAVRPDAAGLREHLKNSLPDYMIPSAFVLLDALPLTPNGKIDRKALPAPDGALVARSAYMAPRTPAEAALAGIWAEVLKVGQVGVNDNFFELGGHSLLATRVTARLRETFGLELPLRALFEAPTLEGLAASVAGARRENAGPLPLVLAARSRPDRVPLSFAQERLWLLDQLEALGSAYHIAAAVRLQGRLEVAALERSFAELIRRHEVLRTRFTAVDGSPVQVIDPAGAFRLEVEDCSGVAAARRRTAAIVRQPFDLARGPLLRARLLKLSAEQHIAIVVLHHIVSDGWSMGVVIGELGALYGAFIAERPSALPELAVQYADYALWQRQWLAGEALARQVGYWKAQLAGAPAALDLPTDRVRPAVQSFKGAAQRFALSAQLRRDLDRLAREEGATLFMVLLAAFQVVLGRWSGQHDIVVGTPIAGRTQRQSEGLIGFFVNTLALRTDVGGDPSFRALLKRVKEVALGAYAHQDLPFEKLVEELQPARDLSRQPIFQVLFGLQNLPRERLELPGLQLSRTGSEHVTAKFDLSLQMAEVGSTLRGHVEYAEDLFDRGTIERLIGHLRTLLEGIAADPDRRLSALPLLTPAERHRLISEWNETAADYPSDKCVHQLFAGVAARTPDAVAVVYEDRQLTYGELECRSNQLAHHLQRLGVGPEVVVGLCVERSLDMVVALLGILKAGGAYLPLDPAYPQERLAYMLADAQAPVLVTQDRLRDQLPQHGACLVLLDSDWREIARQPESAPASEVGPQNLAYVIYTSGSTGQPKGIEVVHYNVGRLVKGTNYADLASENVFLHLAPLAFDASTFEIWGALLNGAELVVYPEGFIDIARLKRIIADAGVSVLWLTAGLFHRVVDEDLQALSPVKQLLTGGDVLSVPHVRRAIEGLKDVQLINGYGPTESTTFSACFPVAGLSDLAITVPIGRPISNTRLYVLDDGFEPVAIGTLGELYIGGAGLARGYLGRAALTAERFVPSPFGDGERLYRTGDLTRWRSDGELEFIGRIDHQVKLRGYRIELGEIETALRTHPGVKDAVVVAREDAPGEKRLVGYVVGRDDTARPDAAALREHLKNSLPDYMIPSAFVRLDALPLTTNGKVDRKALPAPEGRPDVGIYEAPRTPTEEVLAGNWCEVLKLDRVGVHDNFFELGGHSLLATRVTARVRQDFGIELSLRALFEAPTLGGLAARIEAARASGACTPLPLLEACPHKDELPLSFAQERLWLLDQLEALGSTFNVAVAVRLQGRLDVMALERSFAELIRRHEVLRTRYTAVDGSPVQVIEPAGPFPLELLDLSVIAAKEREAEARRRTGDIAKERFDLERGPLFRAVLLRLSVEEHVTVVMMHHIVSDGWSMGILIREIGALYAAFTEDKPSPLPELPVQYADYAIWQRAWLQGKALEQQVAYWKEQLAGAPAALDLPTDRVRPAMQSFKGAAHRFVLSPELVRVLDRLAREEGATLFMVLLAAFKVVLARWSGQQDIVVGTPIAGRTQRQSEGLIGFFVNMLALRTDVSEDPSFRELLRRVKEVALGAYAHQDLPFEKLVEELQPARDLSRQPIFQVLFALQNMPQERLQLPGLQLSRTGSEHVTAKFDLSLYLQEAEHGWGGFVEYATELFERSTIERLTSHFQALLQGIVAKPDCPVSDLPLLGGAERHRLLVEWNDTAADYPSDKCVHELFAAQAARTPDAVAAVYEDQHLTYGELDRRSNQLAHHLRELGVGPEVMVGLCVERSLDMVVGLLGIGKAGGAYLPLDPSYPQERLAYTLTDARAPVVVTQAPLAARLAAHPARLVRLDTEWEVIARQRESMPTGEARPNNLAYLIYTSGSTGKPKGVMIHHGAVVNFLRSMARTPGIDATDVLAAVTPLSFDIAVLEIYLALIAGARIAVIPRDAALDGSRLRERLETVGATIVQATPATWRMLCEAGWEGGTLKVLCGGDTLSLDLARTLAARSAATWNLYGPTEATIWSAAARVVADQPLTIGRPISNTQVHILDTRLELTPIGVPGELFLAGVGLARGYLGRPGLTAERFIPSRFGDGERLYRTGDLARWRGEGELEFIGRIDHQVKLRGYRIEPGEIEAGLRAHAGVKDAVVVAREDAANEKRLVGYVVGRDDAVRPDAAGLREHLKNSLPDYMIPSAFVLLDALPLTPNGKIDRKALPAPDGALVARSAYMAPRTPAEAALAGIWAEVLKVGQVGVNDNFFELGGHSLLATRVTARLRETFGLELPLRALFEAPTLEGLAASVAGARRENAGPLPLVLAARSRPDRVPLSFAQERLWLLDQLEALGSAYHIAAAVRLQGRLEVAALERSFAELIRRHEVLRTRFTAVDGSPVQVIDPAGAFRLEVEDCSGVAAARRRTAAIVRQPFDLARGPLLRARLLKLSAEQHIAIVVLHHIVSDGWSMGVVIGELGALYGAFIAERPSALPELAVQYADYALWQRQWLAGEALARQVGYWKAQLAGAPAALDLPTDRVRPAVQSFKGAAQRFALSAQLRRDLDRLAREEGATLFMVLLAAFQVVLGRWSGQHDIVVGTPIAGRTQRQSEGLIGFFVNTLALRTDVGGDPSFRALLKRVKEVALGAYAHQDLPFEKLVEELQPARDLSRQPIFQVLFGLQNLPRERLELPGLQLSRTGSEHVTAKFDLSLQMAEVGSMLRGHVEYAEDLFDRGTIERLIGHLRTLLEGIAADPDRRLSALPLLTPAERHRLISEWNETAADYPSDKCVHQLFAGVAARTPDAVAVVYEDRQLTYGELECRSNQLAHHLQRLGVGPEVVVGLCVERSLDMVVALLGILKAGGAYLPLDPSYPHERLAYMLADAGATIMVTQAGLTRQLPTHDARIVQLDADREDIARQPESAPASGACQDNLVYVIYTSGSTGKPKGVMIRHGAVMNFLSSMASRQGIDATDVLAAVTPLSFDIAALEIYLALLAGGRIAVIPRDVALDGSRLRQRLETVGATIMQATPATWRMLCEAGWEGGTLKVLCGGDTLSFDLAKALTARSATIWNLYGPTEATIWSAAAQVIVDRPVTIGRPISNTQVHILDARLELTPIGAPGELYLAGVGLARGYFGRPGLTAEHFLPCPFGDGERLYRTGDLARWRSDGELEFIGRIDHQVKLRGYRIELGEIETALRTHPGVKDAVVAAHEDTLGEKRLSAYMVGRDDAVRPDAAALREHLKNSLPDYMIPSVFVTLATLPLTPNGKVDRNSLPTPEEGPEIADYVAPRTLTEEVLAGLWAEVLKIEKVGVNDNFFDLGGYSLLATRVTARIREAFGIELPLRTLFETPILGELSKHIDTVRQNLPAGNLISLASQEADRVRPWFLVE